MAFSFGSADEHVNSMSYGDINAMDAPSAYTIAFWYKHADGTLSANEHVLMAKGLAAGWYISSVNSGQIRVRHAAGGGNFNDFASDTYLDRTAWTHFCITWSGTNMELYENGSSTEGPDAFNIAIVANASPVTLGNLSDDSTGVACSLAHVMWWDVKLTAQEVTSVYAGMLPQGDNLKFWQLCDDKSQTDLISQASPTLAGTVTEVECTPKSNPRPGFSFRPPTILTTIEYVYKVISDTLGLSEGSVSVPTQIAVVSDTIGITDKSEEESGYNEPPGVLTDTISGTSDSTDVVTDGSITTTWTIEESEGLSTEWDMTKNVFIKKQAWT